MTQILSLDDLLAESVLQAQARKLPKHIGTAPQKLRDSLARAPKEVLEAADQLRQWEFKREWLHTANVIVFTRQKCQCCSETSHTMDGLFVQYTNMRVKTASKLDRVTSFELDKPKQVIYRDSWVPICHECADIQQDWPLQGDEE